MTLSLRGGGEGAPYTSWGHLHATQTKLRLDSSQVRKSKTLLDSASRSWIPVCNYWVLESRSWNSDSNCYKGIPDSYSCIADSKAQDSGFHKQKFPRSRIPQKKKKFQDPGFDMQKFTGFRNPHSFTWPWGDEIHTTPEEFTTGLKFMLTRNHLNITKV